ncbi:MULTISPECIES: PorP/SprF family type IX secretion system membrane protein [Tenacibaculum]|uniref:Type IX secretion system membrane protein PorP/SprF n=1 Tax=Tenacibaculum mesophilum TaxID=104268 RepID=A0AAE9MPC0_9FLAO|nr:MULTISPECIES: type IX secretion system membrane protein PorP/SprF [Tenacibaculum]GFD72728.1 membrane protein [Tenacibaculum sp. KUL113]GFD80101.1 membrane protein [Tenacibaculum sp. KUL118]GFD97176.1 membrane protein [Alteromonas sp. KUL154]GFE01800.1 membrane protein [Alteromonas sp. KUL156]AZJ32657.1 type IX secretion system membrane protein PorP/SprF [Tenacibaculum mesophilum]
MKHYSILLLIIISVNVCFSQQDPQYTQYMYNTQVVNPGYIGSKNALGLGLLYRTQWAGFDGAPNTGTFTFNMPLGTLKRNAIGLSIINDKIGPSNETGITIDYAYSLLLSGRSRISFGIKGGLSILDVDYSKLNIYDENDWQFAENIDKKVQPQIGAGIYYNNDRLYLGLSVPNFFNSKHYNSDSVNNNNEDAIAIERLHYFFIAGYVFDISENLKLKPATMFKWVNGSPLQADLSANFLFNNKFTLGASYRWDAAISAMAGFQITNQLFLGMGYDFQTTDIEDHSNGSYEFFLRFDIFNNPERILTPRFF